MNVATRLQLEQRIARKAVRVLLAAGYSLSVNDGEETVLERSTNASAILAVMFTTDEDVLLTHKAGEQPSFVYFVYGNDGYDVISDYGVSLEAVLAPVSAYCDAQEQRYGG